VLGAAHNGPQSTVGAMAWRVPEENFSTGAVGEDEINGNMAKVEGNFWSAHPTET